MKRIASLVLVFVLVVLLCACGKSEAAEMVDSLILSIGTVSLNSEAAISAAENAYAQLPDKDKEKVENLVTLMEARTSYDGLLEQALKQAEEVEKQAESIEQIIQQARDEWESFNIIGTLELLDSITAVTVEQEKEINAFYAEIEENCYEGTHFLKLEHRLNVSSDNYITYADNSKFNVSHDETILNDSLTYHLYGFFGNGASSKLPGLAYSEWCGKRVSVDTEYPELWKEWAIYDSEELKYPEQARVDDLGNVLAWYYRTIGTNEACLEFTILLTNPAPSMEKTSDANKYETENNAKVEGASTEASSGMRNALKAAGNYLSLMPFSHSGLIEQLEFEGYSNSEATYAADNCGANWNEQAARKAKDYLDIMPFSRSGLIEQLEFDGFTHEQAVYGVDKVY